MFVCLAVSTYSRRLFFPRFRFVFSFSQMMSLEFDIIDKLLTPFGEKLPDPSTLKERWCPLEELPPDFKETGLYNYFVLSR